MKQEANLQLRSRRESSDFQSQEHVKFAAKYGPWALVAGASDGVGAAFAEGIAERGVNVVLLARRQGVLDEVAAGIEARTGVETRTLAVDLAEHDATSAIAAATDDLDIGFLVYCAGADPNFQPFLANPIATAEAMVHRNCVVPMQLCHHFAPAMVQRRSGGIVLFGSGAGLAGGPNMVAYGATKAFDMVFAEALWSELHDKGVDVLGLILGKTNTPALRRLEHSRGHLSSEDEAPSDAASVEEVVSEAFDNLTNGPTVMVGEMMRAAAPMLASVTRNEAVNLIIQASAAAMGSDNG
jgi:short-subunit dehydrogenase